MSRPTVEIVDLATGESELREMNDAEFAQFQKDQAETNARIEAANQAAAKRQALLDRLGITEEEARLLLE